MKMHSTLISECASMALTSASRYHESEGAAACASQWHSRIQPGQATHTTRAVQLLAEDKTRDVILNQKSSQP